MRGAAALAFGLAVAPLAAFAAAGPDCPEAWCGDIPAVLDRWQPAERLRYGYGMTARADQAIRWYRQEAEKGDRRAMYNLGVMLAAGMGADPDPAAAEDWLIRALGAGLTEAAFALGNMAREGRARAPDPARAAAYYRTAAGAGLARAMHALGNLHAAGAGVPASLEDAYFWYFLAARKGHGLATAARDDLGRRISHAMRMRAEARAQEWRR